MDSLTTQSGNFTSRKRFQSKSFPRTVREETAFAAANNSELANSSNSPSYTSLKELLPPSSEIRRRKSMLSRRFGMQSAHEIPISNFIVQKAAWAYLQPSPPVSSFVAGSKCILYLVWDEFKLPVHTCLNFINRHVIRAITSAFDRLLGAIHHLDQHA
ncbi:hypothetical protein CFP56_033145 [Quercus suber]|uniref:Uncharacterized protein n=1 Tax=Quercus suber TaxID=58331 RepID=A0AAW0JFV5_QUESU|nr:hypothetical protein CFP56_27484 [Quercus suber]